MLHKHCIFIPFDGFENLKFFSQFCEKIKPDPILKQAGQLGHGKIFSSRFMASN